MHLNRLLRWFLSPKVSVTQKRFRKETAEGDNLEKFISF